MLELEGLGLDLKEKDTSASGRAKSTSTADKSTDTDSGRPQREMSEKSTQNQSQSSNSSLRGFLARASRLLERGEGLRTLVGRSFTRYAESCGFGDPRIISLRTSRVFSPRKSERLSESSSNPWTDSGMMRSGRCLTLRTSESPRTGPECSLRDILEENPDPKYYLSQEAKEKLLNRAKGSRKGGKKD